MGAKSWQSYNKTAETLGRRPEGKPVAHPQDFLYLCTNAKLYGVGGWAKINIGKIIGGNDSMRYSKGR